MSNIYWLAEGQMERFKPFFFKSCGKPCIDCRLVLTGIFFINRIGF